MLFDAGPLTLIVAEEFPLLGAPANLTGFVAEQLGALDGADVALATAGSALAGAPSSGLEGGPAQDLGAAAAELDGQARASDPRIGDVAGSAATLQGEMAGLAGEVASDLDTPIPANPRIPPDSSAKPASPDDAAQPRPGTTAYDDGVRELYRTLLGRTPSAEEIVSHRGNPGGLRGVRDTILASDEYRSLTGGAAPAGGSSAAYPRTDAGVDAFLRDHPERQAEYTDWIARNPGDKLRAPDALGWPGF